MGRPVRAEERVKRLTDRIGKRGLPAPMLPSWQQGQPYSRDEYSPDSYGNYLATSNDVYACAWLRAKNLAKLPVQCFDRQDRLQDRGQPLPALLAAPNPHMGPRRVWAHVELCLAIWGEAVILVEKGEGSGPRSPARELWPVKPTLVEAVPHPTDFLSGYMFTPPGGQPIPLRPDEVIHVQYPNPADPYAPLAPMAAVRLAAEVASESMKANRALFAQGMLAGGFVLPPEGGSYTDEQAKELEEKIRSRFTGASNAHRWQVLKYFLQLKDMGVTPKDAEWINGANLSFRMVCRGMGVPPPLVGDAEYATLANLTVYERALWEHTLEFESLYLADELTRQLGQAYGVRVVFDLGNVVALQEDEQLKWGRSKEQIALGAITVNEWREEQGLSPVPWGGAWWAPITSAPVTSEERPPQPALTTPAAPAEQRGLRLALRRPAELVAIEDGFRDRLETITTRLKDTVLQQLRQGERSIAGSAEEPFDRARWQERIRQGLHGQYAEAAHWVATHEAELLGLSPAQISRLLTDQQFLAAVETLTQQFAKEITQTTWTMVREAIHEGARLGETLDLISARVSTVMDVRIADARRTATTEVTRASTTGQLSAFDAAGVESKRWVTMLDGAVRESHQRMHGVEAGMADSFSVGGGRGPGPGQTGDPAEDVNCRCILQPVIAERGRMNGEHTRALEAVRAVLEEAAK
jgi:HK97 family phage portal protein